MPDLAISGMLGGVTYGDGYVTNAHAWEARIRQAVVDKTPFAPTSNYRIRAASGLSGWAGSYRCWYPVATTTNVTGPAYLIIVHRADITLTCEALDATKFTDTWTDYVAGLLEASGSYECTIGDTTALPAPGTTGTIVVLGATGFQYSIPYAIGDEITASVAADGSSRLLTIPWQSTGVVTPTGSPPLPGTSGAATFTANTGREYSGTILVTSVNISFDAQRPMADFNIGFQGCSTCTPA